MSAQFSMSSQNNNKAKGEKKSKIPSAVYNNTLNSYGTKSTMSTKYKQTHLQSNTISGEFNQTQGHKSTNSNVNQTNQIKNSSVIKSPQSINLKKNQRSCRSMNMHSFDANRTLYYRDDHITYKNAYFNKYSTKAYLVHPELETVKLRTNYSRESSHDRIFPKSPAQSRPIKFDVRIIFLL